MKSKLSALLLALTTLFGLYTPTTNAQTFGEPITGFGTFNDQTSYIGLINDTEYFTIAASGLNGLLVITKLAAYKDKKKTAMVELSIKFNEKKYLPERIVVVNNRLLAYFIASNKDETKTSLYMQEYKENLEFNGKPVRIMDLPNAMDGSKFKQIYGTSVFTKEKVKYQKLDMKHNEVTGNMTFVFSLRYEHDKKISYAKVFTIDQKFDVLFTKDYNAKSPQNVILVDLHKVYDNNDALISIQEATHKSETGSKKFTVNKSFMLFISGTDGDIDEIEIEYDESKIKGIVCAEEISKDNKYFFATHTSDEKTKLVSIDLYEFDPVGGKAKSTNFSLDKSVKLPDNYIKKSKTNLDHLNLSKLFALNSNDLVLCFTNNIRGSYAARVSRTGEVKWTALMRPEIHHNSYGYFRQYYTYINDESLSYIFNASPKTIVGGKLSEETYYINSKSTPIISSVNLESGKVKTRLLDSKNKSQAIIFNHSEMKSNGEYILRMPYNGKIKFVPVTF